MQSAPASDRNNMLPQGCSLHTCVLYFAIIFYCVFEKKFSVNGYKEELRLGLVVEAPVHCMLGLHSVSSG